MLTIKVVNDDSSDSDSDSSDSDSSEEESPKKKRKADGEELSTPKKTKVEEGDNPKNLFVGSLSWNIDDDWLHREFEKFGEITRANVITDKQTGRSKG